jgi:hypothetical protein
LIVLKACGPSSNQHHTVSCNEDEDEDEDDADGMEKRVWRVRLLPMLNSVLLISIIVPIMRFGI